MKNPTSDYSTDDYATSDDPSSIMDITRKTVPLRDLSEEIFSEFCAVTGDYYLGIAVVPVCTCYPPSQVSTQARDSIFVPRTQNF